VKGIILAAGFGTRLAPFTAARPKPLFPAGPRTFLDRSVIFLKQCGVSRSAINLHHLGGQIRRHAAARDNWGLDLVFSEEQRILGTGGGSAEAARLLGPGSLLIVAADIVADLKAAALLAAHRASGAAATIVTALRGDVARYGGILVDDGNRVRDMAGILGRQAERTIVNASVHILEEEIVGRLPGPGGCLVRDFYIPLLREGVPVNAFVHDGFWAEGGTPRLLLDLNRDLLDLECSGVNPHNDTIAVVQRVDWTGPFFVGPDVLCGKNVTIGPHAVVYDGCRLGNGCRVARSVLLPGAVVGPGEEVEGVLRDERRQWPERPDRSP
jgi:mannose-1-phosphate guanylyltransferase